jgi:hypothetical protein
VAKHECGHRLKERLARRMKSMDGAALRAGAVRKLKRTVLAKKKPSTDENDMPTAEQFRPPHATYRRACPSPPLRIISRPP